jgi:UDP-N-acetyl-2-amino-2-deoxyglucuronate dehydrogenase
MTEKIKFAVLGAGHIGKRHAVMIQQQPEAELVALIDIDNGLKTTLEATYKVPFFTSFEEFLAANIAADVVNIATPNYLHASQSILALEKGYHIVCEKPMALRKSDAEEVLFAALQAHKLAFCVMQNRYSPPSEWLKQVVTSGVLGKVFMVQINCYWNRDDRYYKKGGWKGLQDQDGGTLFTQFSHFIDIMFWLFGDIQNIQAKFNDFTHQHSTDFEDSGFVSFDFKKGGMGSLNFSTAIWDKNLESSITIIAENGSIKVGGQYMENVEFCHIKNYTMPELAESNPPNDYGAYKGSAANHHYIIENVIDTLRGRNIATTNALEGLKVVEIIENIYKLKKTNKG